MRIFNLVRSSIGYVLLIAAGVYTLSSVEQHSVLAIIGATLVLLSAIGEGSR